MNILLLISPPVPLCECVISYTTIILYISIIIIKTLLHYYNKNYYNYLLLIIIIIITININYDYTTISVKLYSVD